MGGDEKSPLRQLLEAALDIAVHAAIKDGDPAVARDLLLSGADSDAVATAKDGTVKSSRPPCTGLWAKRTLRSYKYFWTRARSQ